MTSSQSKPHTRSRQCGAIARSVALALFGAQLALGCSLASVKAKPRDARAAADGTPTALCTKNDWSPFVDLGGMLGSAVLMVAAVADDSSVVAGVGAGLTATFGLSAGFGLATAPGCKQPVESAGLATR
jgi:hypothetical protein